MQMRKWVKIVGAIAVVLIAAVVAATALVTQYDYNQLKPTIAKLVKDATGRDLSINGDLDLAVSLSPTLKVAGITLTNAPWGEKGDMVRLDSLAAKVDLLALLVGRIDIDYLVLDGLTLVLQTDGKGLANWEFEAPGGAASATPPGGDLTLVPSVRDIRLRNVDVTYIDGATGKRLNLLLSRAGFVADSFTAPMHGTLAAAYQGVNVNAALDMGSLRHLVSRTGGPFPVDLKVTAPGLDAAIKGTVEQPQAGLIVDARADVALSDTSTMARLMDMALPNLDGLKATVKVSGGGVQYAFTDLKALVNDSDLGGDFTVKLTGARPHVSGQIASKLLDLDQLLGIEAPKAETGAGLRSDGPMVAKVRSPESGPPLFSSTPLALDGLRAVDLSVGIRADRIKLYSLSMSAAEAGVKLAGGKMVVQPLSLTLDKALVTGNVQFDVSARQPTLKAQSTVQGFDVANVLVAMGKGNLLTLPISGTIDVTSKGVSVQNLMGNLNGLIRFSGRDGQINDTTITSLISGVGGELPWANDEDAGRITCMVADFPVENGIATAQTVLADTPNFAVAVTGNVDLGGERLHLTVVPRAKTAGLASFAVPLRVKGALSAPYIDVSPGDAVVGTVGNIFKAPVNILGSIFGTTADAPCVKALSGGKTTPKSSTPPSAPAAKPLQPVEDLGKALKGLFDQ